MIVRNDEELEGLKKIGKIVALAREEMKSKAVPGMTTLELDLIGKKVLEEHGAVSAPIKEYDFPGNTCISLNQEVAHGIPSSKTILKTGDLINIDISAALDGYYADTGISFVLGEENEQLQKLCLAAKAVFDKGLLQARAGKRLNQIGRAVFNEARSQGFTVIKNLTGHGIGTSLHEPPNHIMNYYDPFDNELLKDGMVIAFEPFVSTGAEHIVEGGDGWTFKTPDGSLVAQIEHTIVITKNEPIILTEL
ncbi:MULTISPECIES: type I methionyl aminopeptidase [Bacillus]|uniref:Methionine aminopeptidase n=2 Tax=Bacillus TaxID=1386 RepID=A0A0M4G183_9BACI|nr:MULTISPECIES: type I methionyl aminopeptidase [Bacillus]ALC84025.1 methionine aminopeptidase [Bacillus gobiensis]MBP1082875.1 methionyl aminopeptidase [Bacillus capparidis]MED1098138.1 type I methionyl aminopeptidase [Bacillus capparidis]